MIDALKQLFTKSVKPQPDGFLRRCKGVIHAGANAGQERDVYAQHGLPVVWIEALPAVFEELKANIAPYRDQIAIRALLTARDNETHIFRVANNSGQSSSILDLKYHKDIWPEVHFVDRLEMQSVTLPTALSSHNVDISRYDALVMDTQGSELLILQGSGALLEQFNFIKTEAAEFESYENCATAATLSEFLTPKGFRLAGREKFAEHPRLGAYYDLLFEREAT
ncbi:MAG: FkbM family methyltransferase [Beijerinckiaceae bacterium]|nr:FkbM family methyltransferase [Beijerinckiaceae bacterium]